MVGTVTPDLLCSPECFQGPEVGEGEAPDYALIYRGGATTICPAKPYDLTTRGLQVYPLERLTTEHALMVTRALATLHADTIIHRAKKGDNTEDKPINDESNNENDRVELDEEDSQADQLYTNGVSANADEIEANTENNTSINNNNSSTTEDTNDPRAMVEPGCLKDRWTAQVSRLNVVESNLTIMVKALESALGQEERTVRRLEALKSDLPTLTQFLQFASVMQTTRVPSMGPILIRDVWIPIEEEDQDVIAIRLRGGKGLESPPLRDAAWVWLTLLGGEMLRERYTELCDDYCNAFNKVLLRREACDTIEEMSYFDVMRDLGENFLHAFLTIIHKFVVSGTWFFDRGLHTDEGIQSLADVISFLVDNGIVGSIFVV